MLAKTVLAEEKLNLTLIGDDERGYDFITADTIKELEGLSFSDANVFSLYLDLTTEKIQNAPLLVRYAHLVEQVKEQISDKDNGKVFNAVAENIKEYIHLEYSRPEARGLALFAIPEKVSLKGSKKVKYSTFIHYHLPEPPKDTLVWDKAPELTPLLLQMDEHEPTGVVLVDRQHGRFFLYYMGEAAEYNISEWDDTAPRTKALGMGAHNHEQWLAGQYKRHLEHVVTFIDKIGQQEAWRWLVIGGVDQTPEDLSKELPKTWQDKLIGHITLPLEANFNQVREAAAPLVRQAETQVEKELLTEWVGLLNRQDKAVEELADSLQALQEGRIQTLLVADSYTHDGWQCQSCGALTVAAEEETCPYCGGKMDHVADIVNTAVTKTFNSNGKVEIVRDPDNLAVIRQHGNIGAIFRF